MTLWQMLWQRLTAWLGWRDCEPEKHDERVQEMERRLRRLRMIEVDRNLYARSQRRDESD